MRIGRLILSLIFIAGYVTVQAQQITAGGQPGRLYIRVAGENSIRITLKPLSFKEDFPFTPALAERYYPKPGISLNTLDKPVKKSVGNLFVEVRPDPLTIIVTNKQGQNVQYLIFYDDGKVSFKLNDQPVLGMGEGGPKPGSGVNWRNLPVEYDRRGRYHNMQPRWQADAYGSRNPVAMLVGTEGWAIFVASPWVEVDLQDKEQGVFIPWKPTGKEIVPQTTRNQGLNQGKGLPPVDKIVPGLYDIFVFDAHYPPQLMKDFSVITGPAVMPPRWARGYMQSHRTLVDDNQMVGIVDSFRTKKIPIDAVIYLGTGFTPRGWNKQQPSFEFNPEVFKHNPKDFISEMHSLDVKVVLHMVPWDRDKLPTLHGNIPVKTGELLDVAKFWVESRGDHCSFALWGVWSRAECTQWITDSKYLDPEFGNHSRPTWGLSEQDSITVFEINTIEGHAVKATLLGTGITLIAKESRDPKYIEAASTWWDNMVGKRMNISGGVGSIASGEKFAPDYVLPADGYMETCGGAGSGFFSQRMAELFGDGKYIDELERVLYNVVPAAISLSGDHYYYQNPLVGEGIKRWDWHVCPCCPPSFLKIVGELPKYIYSQGNNSVYVNLFIGSEAKIKLDDSQEVLVKQTTNYPWEGLTSINIEPSIEKEFTVKVRIPGWAQSIENPYGLYESEVKSKVSIKLNGKKIALKIDKGYVAIIRKWAKGDVIELNLPVEPRFVYGNEKVEDLKGMVALASGPVVYGFEDFDNPGLNSYKIDNNSPINLTYKNDVLNGVNIITGEEITDNGTKVEFTAVPYSTLNNRNPGNAFKVWMPVPVKQ